ncbi:MAG: hypothetical protein B7X78_10995 [Sphingomonadales bacterium 39-62-4]|nr:MAG: hypothetical protein B7X78_10995 [Sphingomonadales bacterium 39-62-4]
MGATRIAVMDLPLLVGGDPNKAAVAIFAAGTQAGWKRAAILCKIDDQWTDIGNTAPSAIMGVTRNMLSAHPSFLLDEGNAIDLELLNNSMALALRNTSPLTHDAPVFWINGEFVRVGCIVALGGQSYRLSRLSRGGFAAALQAPAHAADTLVVLMDPDSALLLPNSSFNVGERLYVEAQGLGDALPISTTALVEGLAITSLSPVHGKLLRNLDGSVDLEWKRRSRLDLGWIDGVDQAQMEDAESYRVTLHVEDRVLREWISAAPLLRISATDMAAFSIPQGALLMFHIRQIGRFAQSSALTLGAS